MNSWFEFEQVQFNTILFDSIQLRQVRSRSVLCLVQFTSARFKWIQFCTLALHYVTLRWLKSRRVEFGWRVWKKVDSRHVTSRNVMLCCVGLSHALSGQVTLRNASQRLVRLGAVWFGEVWLSQVMFSNYVVWGLVRCGEAKWRELKWSWVEWCKAEKVPSRHVTSRYVT